MQNRVPVAREERAGLADFVPVPRKTARHDGWTPERQRAFIEALADTGSVSRAARMVNMAQTNAYTLRRAPGAEGFRRAWAAALDFGVQRMKDLAFERAIEGELVPVFVAGKLMGFRRKHHNALLMFCLRHYGQDANGKRTTINYFSTRASAGALAPGSGGEGVLAPGGAIGSGAGGAASAASDGSTAFASAQGASLSIGAGAGGAGAGRGTGLLQGAFAMPALGAGGGKPGPAGAGGEAPFMERQHGGVGRGAAGMPAGVTVGADRVHPGFGAPAMRVGAEAQASSVTVRTVLTGPGSGGAEASAAREDRLAAALADFAGVTLDAEAEANIAAALAACAARQAEAEAAIDGGGEGAADALADDPAAPFLRLPPNGTPYRGALLPLVTLEEAGEWVPAGAEARPEAEGGDRRRAKDAG